MAVATVAVTPASTDDVADKARRLVLPVAVIAAICVVGALIGPEVPSWLDARIAPAFDDLYDWTVRNNDRHWLFTRIFEPISDALQWATDAVLSVLRGLRWPGVLTLVGLIGWRTGGTRAAVAGVLALAGCGVLGFWDDTMITLSLMLVAVAIALAIGVPLGIVAGRNDRADRSLRGVLDTAQVMPAYVYLMPAVVIFGIRTPAAIVATVVFAVAPAVRLTSHGLRSVPVVATEVGTSFGCTSRQLLTKVQLPMAKRAMLLGLNQVIMMAFAIVVLAALVGTGGLGQRVVDGLERVDVGLAFAPGLAIVLAAISLDRISTGERLRRRGAAPAGSDRGLAATIAIGAGIVLAVAGVARFFDADDFPSALQVDVSGPVNDAVGWVNDHLREGIPVVGGTGSFSDFLVIHVLDPVRDVLVDSPWWAVIAGVVAIAWASGGWRLALVCGGCFAGIAAMRNWALAMDTLSQVLVIVAISVALAVPIGIWAGRSDRVQRILRPVLDVAQVMPAFVYLVPVIFLFRVGRVPGVVAAVIYALPPCIRIVDLGLRQVAREPREAAISFGATARQELTKVQLPMAWPAIMLGVNQTVLLTLSMVVIAGLTGSGALGLETVYGLTKGEVGRGVAGGVSIVLLAIALDRITQAWGTPQDRGITMRPRSVLAIAAAVGLVLTAASCGDDDDDDAGGDAGTATTAGGEAPAEGGAGITLAVNPWTGSAVNAHVAKTVLEGMGTPVELVDIDENATWPGMDAGDLDAVLEVWPSGHVDDYQTYVTDKSTVVDMGELGPVAKIGWYVPSFVLDEHPELATWEGLKDPALAQLFATAETGDSGQFLMGDPSYVSYDEQIIANLELPLQFVVAGSEAAEITAIQQAVEAGEPLLFYFWQPHWLHSQVELSEITLPEVTEECNAAAASGDGTYNCDYPPDVLYKAASAGLEEKNPAAFQFIRNFQLTTEQQNEIAALVDAEGMDAAAAAAQWVEANPDVVAAWTG